VVDAFSDFFLSSFEGKKKKKSMSAKRRERAGYYVRDAHEGDRREEGKKRKNGPG
jgi:hypothetical protein